MKLFIFNGIAENAVIIASSLVEAQQVLGSNVRWNKKYISNIEYWKIIDKLEEPSIVNCVTYSW